MLAADEPERLAITGGKLPEVEATGAAVVLAGDPTHRGLTVHEPGEVPRGARRGRRRPAAAARPVRRGRHPPGPARARRRRPTSAPACSRQRPSMDKGHMKTLLRGAGLPVGPYAVVTPRAWDDRPGRGPRDGRRRSASRASSSRRRAGSSVGISKVHDAGELDDAIELARSHDPRVVVEAMLERPRDRVRRARGPRRRRAGGQRPGRGRRRRRPRVLRLRGQVPARRGHRPRRARRPARRQVAEVQALAVPGVRGAGLRGPGPGRLLPHRRPASSSTRSTRCPASRRCRCSR